MVAKPHGEVGYRARFAIKESAVSMLKEFKEFAVRGNVVDMAVGIIIGGAFGKIVSSLVNDIVMPPIGVLLGGIDFKDWSLVLGTDAEGKDVVLNYGQFINTAVDFVIVAFAIFLLIKQLNRFKREEPEPTPTEKKCPHCLLKIPIEATRCGHCTSEVASA